ncbi:MAG: hypothetical protein AAGD01_04710 [Acidobacteriota bacterium]
MYGRRSNPSAGSPGGFQLTEPPPRDVAILLVVVFVTFSLRYLSTTTALIPNLLDLSAAVWTQGQIWRILTYPFIGSGLPDLWFLLELLILFWFARDTYRLAGRRGFWQLILVTGVGAGVVAVAVEALTQAAGSPATPLAFELMQGQRLLLAVFITSFAVAFRHATIRLFFVLPVRAGWFLWLTPLFAFLGFLSSRDLSGFVGICVAVALTYGQLVEGGFSRLLRRFRLRLQERKVQRDLRRIRRESGLRLVDEDDDDPRGGGGGQGGGRGGNGREGNGREGNGREGNGRGSNGVSKGPWVN